MKAKIHITLKNGVLDPQGKAIAGTLHNMGFGDVAEVKQGKFIEIDLTGTDATKAKAQLEEMCQKLLANTVVENYTIALEG
jgi:phosphoribosylformylglycinamidine synthase PurS subunit